MSGFELTSSLHSLRVYSVVVVLVEGVVEGVCRYNTPPHTISNINTKTKKQSKVSSVVVCRIIPSYTVKISVLNGKY